MSLSPYFISLPQRNGFFVECGALDGETRSNTLTLEKELGVARTAYWRRPQQCQRNHVRMDGKWQECRFDFLYFSTKHRKAWLLPNCLSPHGRIFKTKYQPNKNMGKIISDPKCSQKNLIDVVCFPLFSFWRLWASLKLITSVLMLRDMSLKCSRRFLLTNWILK